MNFKEHLNFTLLAHGRIHFTIENCALYVCAMCFGNIEGMRAELSITNFVN